MLNAFTGRDYGRALELARHLSKPLFEEFWAQGRARELVAEIPRRGEDFRSLALPTESAWAVAREGMTRERQIEFLAARLRLIHDVQLDIPGGVNWNSPQYDVPDDRMPPWPAPPGQREAHLVVNPYAELASMDLTGAESARLVPWLASEDHILAYDLPRFMPHFPQTLHRVRWLVGSILDLVLGDDAVDRAVIEGTDPAARERHLSALGERATAAGATRESDRRVEELRSGTDDRALQTAYMRLGSLDPERGARVLLERARREPERRADWVRLAYALDAPRAADAADEFVEDPDEAVAFWAAAIGLRHGEGPRKRRGLDRLLAALDRGDPHARIDVVIDDLLATKDPRVSALIDQSLAERPCPEHAPTLILLQRSLLLGMGAAF
jgi:hypothetical protein